MQVVVFSTKPYDRAFLEAENGHHRHALRFVEARLMAETAVLAVDADAVCAFVNDQLDAAVHATPPGHGIQGSLPQLTPPASRRDRRVKEESMANRPVREMIERNQVVCAPPSETVRAACEAMTGNRCGSILVMEGQRLLGIFTERDLLTRVAGAGKDVDATRLDEVMTRDPDTIGADEPVKEAIRKMDEFSYRYLPVIDRDKVIGVISTRHLPFGEVLNMQWELGERHTLAERMW